MAEGNSPQGIKMNKILGKIGLGMETYRQAYLAVRRQFEPSKITMVQNLKLQRLIHYSFHHIKYYRELFEREGIKPEQIKTAGDLVKIPLLTKEELRSRFWDFLPAELPGCRISRTSGSTGIPVCILSDRSSRCFNSAAVIRYRNALGIPIAGRPILSLLKTENEQARNPHWTFMQGIHKTYYINPYIDSGHPKEYARKILTRLKKPALIGITPAVKTLAYKIRDGVFPPFTPSAILTTGEHLSCNVRDLIESTLGAKVTDIYACNEAGDVAWQCSQAAGYHINVDNCIVEIVKDDKPAAEGQTGEVVITNLNRFAMPIIRYKNGDLARLTNEPCLCGCRLPMIAEIAGRTGEDIFLPNGKKMPWNRLKSLMNHPLIRQFQIIQNDDGNLAVKYVCENQTDTKQLEDLLLYRYRNLLGDLPSIEIKEVKTIAAGPGGKSKLVISNYKPA